MKETARDSLRGQNEGRRVAGVGSSPALSPSQRTRLWKRLRKYDRQIAELQTYFRFEKYIGILYPEKEVAKNKETLKKLDQKRYEVRMKLKGYHHNNRLARDPEGREPNA